MRTDKHYITTLVLDQNFRNKRQIAPVKKVTAPNGHVEYFRQDGLTEGSAHVKMWNECGCDVIDLQEERECRGCEINGIRLEYGKSLNILMYESEDKPDANDKYFRKGGIGEGLKERGYKLISHSCDKMAPKYKTPTETCLDDNNTLNKQIK